MKIKQQPDDFKVEELTDIRPGDSGPYAFYRLEKTGWTTHDALAALRRRWQLEPYRVSYGGLKDRHAHTIQYLTVYHGPKRNLTHHSVRVVYLGQVDEPFSSGHIRGNRFEIVMRALNEDAAARAAEALSHIARDGIPNYFDDQRFGSIAAPGGLALGDPFMARALVQGRYEDALRLVLLAPYEHDRAPEKREKAILEQHWGDWATCKQRLPRGHARSLIDYLEHHPQDFKGTVERLRPDLRSLYLSAWQSFLWNRMLAVWLERNLSAEQITPLALRLGTLPAPRHLSDTQRQELHALRLPLPSAQVKLEEADPRLALLKEVLAEQDITLEQFKLRGFKKMFFSKGDRAAFFVPQDLTWQTGTDELNRNRQKLSLSFVLPRGCYATMVIKRAAAT